MNGYNNMVVLELAKKGDRLVFAQAEHKIVLPCPKLHFNDRHFHKIRFFFCKNEMGIDQVNNTFY